MHRNASTLHAVAWSRTEKVMLLPGPPIRRRVRGRLCRTRPPTDTRQMISTDGNFVWRASVADLGFYRSSRDPSLIIWPLDFRCLPCRLPANLSNTWTMGLTVVGLAAVKGNGATGRHQQQKGDGECIRSVAVRQCLRHDSRAAHAKKYRRNHHTPRLAAHTRSTAKSCSSRPSVVLDTNRFPTEPPQPMGSPRKSNRTAATPSNTSISTALWRIADPQGAGAAAVPSYVSRDMNG
jgi:hypothetical protein